MKPQVLYIGVDVSKETLDYFIPAVNHGRPPVTGEVRNNETGVRKLRDLARKHGATVCCEPTGGYEDLLVEGMLAAGVPVAFAEGYRVRHFAEASGEITKNDRVDSGMIVRFAEAIGPRRLSGRDKTARNLRSLWRLREDIIQSRRRYQGLLEKFPGHVEGRWLRAMVGRLEAKERELLAKCVKLVRTDPESAVLFERFQLVRGVGPATAIAVLAEFSEIGGFTLAAAAKMAGLAPAERSSGKLVLTRHIRGGRPGLRKQLYMASISAVKYNRVLKAYYERKCAKGHRGKWALVPVMRKLLRVLCKIARDPDFVPWDDSMKGAELPVA